MNLYWLTRLDSIHYSLCTIGIMGSLISLAIMGVHAGMATDYTPEENRIKYYNVVKKTFPYLITLVLIFFAGLFTPTTKEMAFILVGDKVIESGEITETVEQVGELKDLAVDYLKRKLTE